MADVHRIFVDAVSWANVEGAGSSWEACYVVEGDRIVLTDEAGTPIVRARNERWEQHFTPYDNIDVVAKRLVKRRMAQSVPEPGLRMPKMPPLGLA
jgi:hypothetical protein